MSLRLSPHLLPSPRLPQRPSLSPMGPIPPSRLGLEPPQPAAKRSDRKWSGRANWTEGSPWLQPRKNKNKPGWPITPYCLACSCLFGCQKSSILQQAATQKHKAALPTWESQPVQCSAVWHGCR
jgi:hypothetical protein